MKRSYISTDTLEKLANVTGLLAAVVGIAVFFIPQSAQVPEPRDTSSDSNLVISFISVIFSVILGVGISLLTSYIEKYREGRRQRKTSANQQEREIYQSVEQELLAMIEVASPSEIQKHNNNAVRNEYVIEGRQSNGK